MAVIKQDNGLHTMIVTFVVSDRDEQQQLVEDLRKIATDHSKLDGFVSCSVHASEDGVRVAEYIQWRTGEDMVAAISTPEGQAHVNDPRLVADAHVYRIVEVFEVVAGTAG